VPARLCSTQVVPQHLRSDVRRQGCPEMARRYGTDDRLSSREAGGRTANARASIRGCGREFPPGEIFYSMKRDQSAGVAVAID
jgi:hypothetical protein